MSHLSKEVLEALRFEDEDGDYYAATGITLTLMYAQRMGEMLPVFKHMVERFTQYIAPQQLDSYKKSHVWRDYKSSQINRLLNVFTSDAENGEELVLAKLEGSGHFQYFGEYGLRLKGRKDEVDSPFRHTDVCAAYFELPIDVVERVGRDKLLQFVQEVANLAPFAHGMCGYTFKYFHRTGDSDIDEWMGNRGLRFFGVHPFRNSWEYYCRKHLPNVNWLTLLGTEMVAQLGGTQAMRSQLTPQVGLRELAHGVLLQAGDAPVLGDINALAPDIGPLREVARLTRPLLLPRDRQCNSVLNYLFDETEDGERWLDRFEHPALDSHKR